MKIFLSHATADKPLVRKVHSLLCRENAWLDEVDIENGENIVSKINEGLKEASHFVLFWSKPAAKSKWVEAEVNAAFVRYISGQCKLMMFVIDKDSNDDIEPLLQPFKYDVIDDSDNLNQKAQKIYETIMAANSISITRRKVEDRFEEISKIDTLTKEGCRMVVLYGLLGVGKSSLARKAFNSIYTDTVPFELDFYNVPGPVELYFRFARQFKLPIPKNIPKEDEKKKLEEILEIIASQHRNLILRDVKGWLLDDGTPNEELNYIFNRIIKSEMFSNTFVLVTSSRHIELPRTIDYIQRSRSISIRGVDDATTAAIIMDHSSLLNGKIEQDKVRILAKKLHGYPLAAELMGRLIDENSVDYYLSQEFKVNDLKIGLAKELISYSNPDDETVEFLKLIALAKSCLYNEEYAEAMEKEYEEICRCADKAYQSGFVFYEDGCYKLEHIIENYYYSIAHNDPNWKKTANKLVNYLCNKVEDGMHEENVSDYLRLIPIICYLLALTNKTIKINHFRTDMNATMGSAMWDQYNSRDYTEADDIALALLEVDKKNYDAMYVHSLCLIRKDHIADAEKIIEKMLEEYPNRKQGYYAMGNLFKSNGNYEEAITWYSRGVEINNKYAACYRGLAECYLYLGQVEMAETNIDNAIQYAESNLYNYLIKSKVLEAAKEYDKAIDLLAKEAIGTDNKAQLYFRLGRLYALKNNVDEAIAYYKRALECNPNEIDAEISLVSIYVSQHKIDLEDRIKRLKEKANMRRKYIISNIEARYVGYVQNNPERAIEILDSVDEKSRDQQWYVVKGNLLERVAESFEEKDMNIIAEQKRKEVKKIEYIARQRFGESYEEIPEYIVYME